MKRAKKIFGPKAILSLSVFFLLCTYLIYATLSLPLPDANGPVRLYSNQCGDDLRKLHTSAIRKAQKGVYARIFGLTDERVMKALSQSAERGITTTVAYDEKGSGAIPQKQLCSRVNLYPLKLKALMHQKLLITDKSSLFLGSANWTASSLTMHENLTIGIYSPILAKRLQMQEASFSQLRIGSQTLTAFLLPNCGLSAEKHLIELIDQAEKEIRVAIFTFTHPELCDALMRAKKRGVDVQVRIDGHAGRGSGKKIVKKLLDNGLHVQLTRGIGLLHHKWMLIDQKILATGSANWTPSAFHHNEDLLIVIEPLSKNQYAKIQKIWKRINV